MSHVIQRMDRRGGWTIRGFGGGGKGGGAGRQPVEARDSLHSISYAHVLLNLGVGEFEGFPSTNPLRDIFLDGTPIANEDGSLNFTDVTVDYRSGTANQEPIEGFTASENTTEVGVEFRSDSSWSQSISNTELSALRLTLAVNGLSSVNTSNGDVSGYRVDYKIELSTDGAPFQDVFVGAFDGKTTSQYARSHRVQLPPSSTGWVVRVSRQTPNATSSTISDGTFVQLISYLVDARFRWPMCALLAVKVDAAQFRSIPTISCRHLLRRIRVPSNYDPETRVYTGTWDGTFKTAFSDNPAWTFYDVATNPLWGTGDAITLAMLDRYSLYAIGRYCDEMVPDGKGGFEPRFTCNTYIQTRVDAWRMLQDYASIFRGLAYYSAGTVVPTADMPKDSTYTYNNTNVIDGKFTRVGSSQQTRYTSVLISWNDLTDQGKAKLEAVEDPEGLRRYGLNQKDLTAFGCTSQGQAQRAARSFLYTSLFETQGINFSVGLDGVRATPGQIIKVADRNRAGRRASGRLANIVNEFVTVEGGVVTVEMDPVTVELPEGSGFTATRMTLDADALVLPGDQLTITMPSGITETRTVLSYAGRIVEVTSPFSEVPLPGAVWLIENAELAAEEYRVIDVVELEGGTTFSISATQYVRSKFLAVDNDTNLQLPPVTVIPPTVQPKPSNVLLSSFAVINQGITSQTAVIEWDAAEGASYYNVQWKRDNSDWVNIQRVSTTRVEIENAYAGGYLARVQAVNALETSSIWQNSALTQLDGIIGAPPTVSVLVATGIVFGINISWAFPNAPSIIEKTEIWYSQTNDRETAIKLGDYAYPQNNHTLMGLAAAQTLYFWARLIDKNGTVGAWYPSGNGVSGQSLGGGDADLILSYLGGKISDTELNAQLLERIDSGGESAIIVEELITKLAALWTIKTQVTVDGRNYIAGIGVGVENDDGVVESQVLLAASRVAILDPNVAGSAVLPFVVQGGQVFINSAVIGHASIGSVNLANWLESDAKTPDGEPILRMNFRTGEIEINSVDASGAKARIVGGLFSTYYPSGNLATRMGIW